MKFKNLCVSKDTINETKTQPKEKGEFFANHILIKRFVSGIYEELLQLNNERINYPRS
jgi:hypothetical protein